jgi:hypothetical protein
MGVCQHFLQIVGTFSLASKNSLPKNVPIYKKGAGMLEILRHHGKS